ncbi:MAG: DNA-binding response regulator [Actinotalea sp.]|nr:DNA-binding response regulator [Actinotalea sp.]
MGPVTVRVVVVDDDALVRAGLRMILGGAADLEVVGEASDGQEAVEVIERLVPDVVLMDVRMPRLDGLAAARRLRERGSPVRVIVLTTFDTDETVLTALRDGAAGFLLKDTPPADLVDAVRRVAVGQPMLSPTVTARLIAAVAPAPDTARRRSARTRLARLTDREREVAEAVAAGLTNAEIAASLHMGVATVKTHVGSLFAKLEVTNRVQVARSLHDDGGG